VLSDDARCPRFDIGDVAPELLAGADGTVDYDRRAD